MLARRRQTSESMGTLLYRKQSTGHPGEKCLDVQIEKSRFYEMGFFEDAAITLDDSRRCAVIGCDLFELGGYGISLNGGDAYTMTRSENLVENCYIHHTGRLNRHGFCHEYQWVRRQSS